MRDVMVYTVSLCTLRADVVPLTLVRKSPPLSVPPLKMPDILVKNRTIYKTENSENMEGETTRQNAKSYVLLGLKFSEKCPQSVRQKIRENCSGNSW